MTNEFEAKDIIIDMFDKSELKSEQKDATIKELADYYNLTYHDFLKEGDIEHELKKFKDWYDGLQPHQKTSVWSDDGQSNGLVTMNSERIVEKYLKRK